MPQSCRSRVFGSGPQTLHKACEDKQGLATVHRVSCLVLKKKLDLGLIASGVFQGPGRFQGSGQKGLRLESVSLAIRILRYGAFKSLV